MKRGSAILIVLLFLSIVTIYMSSLLNSSGLLVEASKIRQQEIKNIYAAEGLVRVGIEAFKDGVLKPGGSLDYLGGTISAGNKGGNTYVKSAYKGRIVDAKLRYKSNLVSSWRTL